MSFIGWIVLGLIAGFIASKVVNKRGEGVVMDIVLGIVGAIVGGFLFSMVGGAGVTGFNIYSMIVAVVGAIVVLLIYHAIVGRKHDDLSLDLGIAPARLRGAREGHRDPQALSFARLANAGQRPNALTSDRCEADARVAIGAFCSLQQLHQSLQLLRV